MSGSTQEITTQTECNHGYTDCKPTLHSTCRHCGLPIKQTVGRLDQVASGPQRGPWMHYSNNLHYLACSTTNAQPTEVLDA